MADKYAALTCQLCGEHAFGRYEMIAGHYKPLDLEFEARKRGWVRLYDGRTVCKACCLELMQELASRIPEKEATNG